MFIYLKNLLLRNLLKNFSGEVATRHEQWKRGAGLKANEKAEQHSNTVDTRMRDFSKDFSASTAENLTKV
jgi:hypothetical protein